MSFDEIKSNNVKGRKEYYCSWCNEAILKGMVHQSRAYIMEGDFQTSREHLECAKVMSTLTYKDWDEMDGTYYPGEFKRGSRERQ